MQVFHGTADTTLYPQKPAGGDQAVDGRAGAQRDGEQHDEQYAGRWTRYRYGFTFEVALGTERHA